MLALLASLLLADLADGGKVVLLQGTIETKAPADPDFKPLKAGDAIEDLASIRTAAKSKGLLSLPGGVELRMNEQTELALEAPRKILIKKGRLMLLVPKGSPPTERSRAAPSEAPTFAVESAMVETFPYRDLTTFGWAR